jgi:hypothetical protein
VVLDASEQGSKRKINDSEYDYIRNFCYQNKGAVKQPEYMKIDKLKKFCLLPIVRDLVNLLSELTSNFCYEFDLTKAMIIEQEDTYDFILANQLTPLFYRKEWLKTLHNQF